MKRLTMLLFVLALGVNMTAFASNDNGGTKNEGAKIELNSVSVKPSTVFNLDLQIVNKEIKSVEVKQTTIKLVALPDCSNWEDTGVIVCDPYTGVQKKEQRRLCLQGHPTTYGYWEYRYIAIPD